MFIAAGILALVNAPWWGFIAVLGLGGPILIVYGHKAAAELGVRSRDETPRGWLLALAMTAGLASVLAAHTGRYASLIVITYIVLAHTGERVAWARFRATRTR